MPHNLTVHKTRVGSVRPLYSEILLRARQAADGAGGNPYRDVVVLRFPSFAHAQAWHASAEYQALVPLRQQAAEVMLSLYEA
jgi:uncharacterized protein (DUF1330 family)